MADVLDVWLDSRFAGKLMRGEQGLVEFIYDAHYRGDAESTPLSASMPKSDQGHGPDVVMPWLSNLLPDAEEVRARWAAKFGERRTDPFTLLAHMGEDAPGSVQIVAEDVVPAEAGELSEMTERDIARRVRDILADPDHWVDDGEDDASRFSLGGNQGKFALARIDGRWFEPNGRAPSTHIVKPGMVLATGRPDDRAHTDDHVQAVEFVTMLAARKVGIRSAKVELLDFDGLRAFVTTRYDRQVTADGVVRRIHQEDFCQALSVLPSRKYEQDGGPTMSDMKTLVSRESSPAYRVGDGVALTQLFIYNLLVAGIDAHAKNHSLLHLGGSTRLAPAYDLISAHGLWSEDRVQFKSAAAVKYGKERPYRQISGRNLARTADVLGVPRGMFLVMLKEMAQQLPDAFESAIGEVPGEMVTELLRAMPARAGRFAHEFVRRMSDADIGLKSLPRFGGSRTIGHTDTGRTWVPGGWQGRRWVSGRYVTRQAR